MVQIYKIYLNINKIQINKVNLVRDFFSSLSLAVCLLVLSQNNFVRSYISYAFEADLAEVFNDPTYDSLMDIEDFKNIRELYKEENYTTDFHRSFTYINGIDGIPDYPEPTFIQFPLFSALNLRTAQDWKNFFDYMLLYKNSSMFQMEKKIVEETA